MVRSTVTAAVFLVTCFVGDGPCVARADEARPSIANVRLTAAAGYLTGEVTCSTLFSERVVGTVQSGLPAVVDLMYYLSARDGGVQAENVLSFSLLHDVWEDTYSIEAQDTTFSFPTFAEMQRAIEHLRHLPLVPLDALNPGQSYRLHMSIMVNPLQGVDPDRMAMWMSENMRSSDDDSWHEQVLDLNEIISQFFSRERSNVNRSSWYQSASFKPDSLMVQEQERE